MLNFRRLLGTCIYHIVTSVMVYHIVTSVMVYHTVTSFMGALKSFFARVYVLAISFIPGIKCL